MELTVSLLVDARAMLCLAPCAFGGARVRMGLPLCLKFQRCCTHRTKNRQDRQMQCAYRNVLASAESKHCTSTHYSSDLVVSDF
jgi:hypothetical protein